MIPRPFQFLAPAPSAPQLQDPGQIGPLYAYWRKRILLTSLAGYALFYFVRKNLSLAIPEMERTLGVTKTDLGLFLTAHNLLYGVSKFVNGFLGDRTNPRWFMPLGLVCSAAMNAAFGLSSGVTTFGVFWMLNGWFQGMGFPPCARSLTHWFAPSERGTKFAIWNTSHSIGAGLVLVLCSFLVGYGWRLCFLVPAAIATVGALYLAMRLRDRPQSLGLPAVENRFGNGAPEDSAETEHGAVIRRVFMDPVIWMVSLANFFVYTVRYAILDWGPTILSQMKDVELHHAGWTVAAYEGAGIAGMLVGGWLTDRIFGGRGSRACAIYMLVCSACVWLFWKAPSDSPLVYTLILCGVGFSIYGPQCLVGVIAANRATKHAAATAIGLTGLFGYLSGILSGWGLGKMMDVWGWDPVFRTLLAAAMIAAVLFALCWRADRSRRSPKEA